MSSTDTAQAASLFQSPWQQAQGFVPQLAQGVSLSRRDYRGQRWYVVQLVGHAQLLRINHQAWQLLMLCDGERNLGQIFSLLQRDGVPIDSVAVMSLSNQLLQQNILFNSEQQQGLRPAGLLSRMWANPMGFRLPLIDPDAWLDRYIGFADQLFSRSTMAVWCLSMLLLLFFIAESFQPLSSNVIDTIFRPENVFWLAIIYPISKLLHELSHALAVKKWGGRVSEIGIVFMYGLPIPYVDASAANAFDNKYCRMVVDGAGMAVELVVALLALMLWLLVEPGLVSQIAYNTFWLCSVSTLFFNANPLMRFDGYYLLADIIEIPNLATRSTLYWRYFFCRYVFLERSRCFVATPKERVWFFSYGLLAGFYRYFLLISICYIALQFHWFLGITVGCWMLLQFVIRPMGQLLSYCLHTEQRRTFNSSKAKIFYTLIFSLVVVVTVVPMPVSQVLNGVVSLPDNSRVVASESGYLVERYMPSGADVLAGMPLLKLSDDLLATKLALAEAAVMKAEAQYDSRRAKSLRDAGALKVEKVLAREQYQQLLKEQSSLELVSSRGGVFYPDPLAADNDNRYVTKGELLAYVIEPTTIIIKAVVAKEDIAMFEHKLSSEALIKLANYPTNQFVGHIVAISPQAKKTLPSPVLGAAFGGDIAIEAGDNDSATEALVDFYQIEIAVENSVSSLKAFPGGRAWVRVDYPPQTLLQQLQRQFAQLFISIIPR
ncbi:hypothetical protein SIN8267_00629 [Sinobacterium norvegicum]|uniref:Peptidase M50 n=1 Tax=Sinobacterium norvegicum TaxID=1641715 RepID=A0ABN8EGR3_9GAMM|nr:HlyD family secretion protein [Sinobacterium norvegicum]CAH0990537.1 hypothetical protein SIN8267_00629 [Sinobacterium norvegicum]